MSCEEYGKEPLVEDCCRCGQKLSQPSPTIFGTFYFCDDCSNEIMPFAHSVGELENIFDNLKEKEK